MGYKISTIAKFHAIMSNAIKVATNNLENLHVSVSLGNKKIGKCLNVSLAPIITCGANCRVCSGICYDIKACLFRKQVMNARARNTALAMTDRERYFSEIDNKMTNRRKHKVFRWHVGGDIPDMDYFERMIENARRHSDFVIWTYTKQYHIVNDYVRSHGGNIESAIPSNLSIMFSVWDGLVCDNPYGFATFACVLNGHDWPIGVHRCNGACHECVKHHTGCPYRINSAVAEH